MFRFCFTLFPTYPNQNYGPFYVSEARGTTGTGILKHGQRSGIVVSHRLSGKVPYENSLRRTSQG